MSKVQDVKKSSLTFAPEAGSQRLRNVINKGLTEEMILHGAGEAFKGGWNQVKLYFMLGLPTETEEDMKGIAHLAQKIAETYYEEVPKEQRKGKVQVNVSTSFFVPKPFTPFQWAGMYREEDFVEKAKVVKSEIRAQVNQRSIRYSWHEPDVTILEGFLARGDRRCAQVILKAYEKVQSMMPGQRVLIITYGKKLLQKPIQTLISIHSANVLQTRSFHGISLMQE